MPKKLLCLLCALVCCAALLTACSGQDAATSSAKEQPAAHEPITIQAPFRNVSAFIDVVHEQYPEINIELVPYSGKNYTAYAMAQLAARDMPDIYCTTYYVPGLTDVSDKLLDLSGYAFTDRYTDARLREV